MIYIKKNLDKVVSVIIIFLLPVLSFADTTIANPLPKATSLGGLIQTILQGLIKIGMPVLVLAIIYSGFLFVSAQGNPEKITDAKRSLMYTLIGAGILLGSWAIAQLITSTVQGLQ